MVAFNSKAKPTAANLRRRLSTVLEAIQQASEMIQQRDQGAARACVKLDAARRLVFEAAAVANLKLEDPRS